VKKSSIAQHVQYSVRNWAFFSPSEHRSSYETVKHEKTELKGTKKELGKKNILCKIQEKFNFQIFLHPFIWSCLPQQKEVNTNLIKLVIYTFSNSKIMNHKCAVVIHFQT